MNILVADLSGTGDRLVEQAQQAQCDFRVLDCFSDLHHLLAHKYKDKLLHVHRHKHDVVQALREGMFVAALVVDGEDLVRSSLVIQSLRSAQVAHIFVVTNDLSRAQSYRKLGAHEVCVGQTPEVTWSQFANRTTVHLPA